MPLKPGSAIAIVAPAGPPTAEPFAAGRALLAQRYRIVRDLGAEAAPPPALPYLAQPDAARAEQLNAALADPQVEAVFCARGGYGCARILAALDPAPLVRRRVPLVGLSDCTALHLWAACHGAPTVHGPVVTQLPVLPPGDLQHLFQLLEGAQPAPLTGLQPLHPGRARGPLLGGNLSLLASLQGTPYVPSLHGCILLLEEVNEPPYRLDRLLTQLLLGGALSTVSGVLIGSLQHCDANQGVPPRPTRALDVVAERLATLGVPVVAGAPVGHGERHLALPLGRQVVLDASLGQLTLPPLWAPPPPG